MFLRKKGGETIALTSVCVCVCVKEGRELLGLLFLRHYSLAVR